MIRQALRWPERILVCGVILLGFGAPAFSNPSQSADGRVNPQSQIDQFEQSVRALEDRSNTAARRWTINERMAERRVPGIAVAIIQDGQIIHSAGYGLLARGSAQRVDDQTVFSAGSVSKVVNAVLILRLAQEGIVDLDEDVNTYLTSWKVPSGPFTASRSVTLRQLLSHTSGFSQHGFPDFRPGQALPTTVQTLEGIRPAKHDPVRLMFEPGTRMKYSGGGITVAQLVVEDVLQKPYEEVAQQYIFRPLGMERSTFSNPLPEDHGNIAKAHSKHGKLKARPRGYETMPELAASGLWTSAGDMVLFLKAALGNNDFLSPEMREQFLTRAPSSWHGMGPRLNGSGAELVFHHGGANDHYKSWIEGHPATGDGMVILTNGASGRELGYELRISAGEAFGWNIAFPQDFAEPTFDSGK